MVYICQVSMVMTPIAGCWLFHRNSHQWMMTGGFLYYSGDIYGLCHCFMYIVIHFSIHVLSWILWFMMVYVHGCYTHITLSVDVSLQLLVQSGANQNGLFRVCMHNRCVIKDKWKNSRTTWTYIYIYTLVHV